MVSETTLERFDFGIQKNKDRMDQSKVRDLLTNQILHQNPVIVWYGIDKQWIGLGATTH
jgi:hypothetical protein